MVNIIEQDRQLNIESITWRDSQITFAGIESESKHMDNPDIVPWDWQDRLVSEARNAEHIFVEYFPPEIEQNLQWVPSLAKRMSKMYIDEHMQVYSFMADWAKNQQKDILCANIATMPRFALYEIYTNRKIFGYVEYSPSEQKYPSAINARRIFTARAIQQLITSQDNDTSVLYIAAPAHINRVNRYIQTEKHEEYAKRFSLYSKIFFPLDRNIRRFTYDSDEWLLDEVTPIKKPQQS